MDPEELWARYGSISLADVPPDAQARAAHSVLDWVGCVLAGSAEPLSAILRAELVEDRPGPVSVLGTGQRSDLQTAVLVNGAAGHALDYDDTNTVGGFHPSAPVLPAAWALAEAQGRTGADLLTAVVVGIEVGSRYGAAIGLEHYAKGWHTTSSIGVFGATAAAAWLLGLDAAQFGHAIGLAASLSSGVQANFGTMVKPFHAGHAAERGLLAARLARRGYIANPEAFDATAGLVEAAGSGAVDEERLAAVAGVWVVTRTLFKFHAACHGTHAAIESVLKLRPQIDPDAVNRIEITVHPNIARVCKVVIPESGLEAKFSLPAATALALLGEDTADPGIFNRARVSAPDVDALMRRTEVRVTATEVSPTESVVRIRGEAFDLTAKHDIGIPEPDLALQDARLRAKFERLAGPTLGPAAADLADQLVGISGMPRLPELP